MTTKKRITKKKSAAKLKPISYYRKNHEAIPAKVYKKSVRGQATKTLHDEWGSSYVVRKNNYAPWGCPPTGQARTQTWNPMRDTLTAKGMKAKGLPVTHDRPSNIRLRKKARKGVRTARRTNGRRYNDEEAYRNALASYEDEMAREQYDYTDMRTVDADLEDMGYGDTRKRWKQMAARNKIKARNKLALQELKDRGWY